MSDFDVVVSCESPDDYEGNLLKLYLLMVDGRLAVVGVATKN